jgi:hypothetical protein
MNPKSILTILIIVVLSTNSIKLFSQETVSKAGTQSAKFGGKIGINFASLYTQNASDKVLLGLNAGVFLKVPLSKYFAVQPELNFSMKGARVDYSNPLMVGTARYSFNYLEVPVLAVFNITENVNAQFGPYFAYLITGSIKNNSTTNAFDFENAINPNNYNRVDYGAMLGVSVNIDRLGVGLRYSRGFSTIGNETTISNIQLKYPDAINSVFNLYVALSF